MIDTVLKIIKDEVQTFLNLKMRTGGGEDKIHLAPLVDQNGKPVPNENTVSMNLVKIEEDRTNMSFARLSEVKNNNKVT